MQPILLALSILSAALSSPIAGAIEPQDKSPTRSTIFKRTNQSGTSTYSTTKNATARGSVTQGRGLRGATTISSSRVPKPISMSISIPNAELSYSRITSVRIGRRWMKSRLGLRLSARVSRTRRLFIVLRFGVDC